MTGRLEGKVAFITGAARGQGRAHAVRMAEEGADIIAIDVCESMESVPYPLANPEDLSETETLVKERGRRILARQADVRDRAELRDTLEAAMADLGHLDIVVANAGIFPMRPTSSNIQDFQDAIDVDLIGVMNSVAVSLNHIADHGSIIITGSTAAMIRNTTSNPGFGSGGPGYSWAKQTLVQYSDQMALHLAPRFIRVNCMHPTNVNTQLMHHAGMYSVFRPDIENPTREDVLPAFARVQAMPIPYVEPEDVANLAVFLASDESRYITGQQIRVDAGAMLKFPDGPMG